MLNKAILEMNSMWKAKDRKMDITLYNLVDKIIFHRHMVDNTYIAINV